jgi:hypothetical protein
MSFHDPFEYLQHKLWLQERLGIKVLIWLPTIKDWESPWIRYVKVVCKILLESFQQGLQFFLKITFIKGL